MSKYVNDTASGKSVTAYVVLNKKGAHVATVRAVWSKSGVCLVNVHDDAAGFQHAKAGGGGYDKFTACLNNMTIDGHKLSDHCADRIKLKKGQYIFPSNSKAPKGYSFANHCEIWADGRAYDKHAEIAKFRATMDFDSAVLAHRSKRMQQISNGEIISGWRDCYRESGLDYLTALGYRVIKAI